MGGRADGQADRGDGRDEGRGFTDTVEGMGMSDWTDAIVGERMTVDNQFTDRVAASRFSSQEWGLIMTATEFEIENADDSENARIVADTSSLPAIMPELENVRSQVAAMGGAPGGRRERGSGGGLVDSIKGALGLGGSGGQRRPLRRGARRGPSGSSKSTPTSYRRTSKRSASGEQVRVAYQE